MAPDDEHHLRATLSVAGFRRLVGVRVSSQLADGIFQAALAGSVLFNPDRQTSPLAVATGTALLVLPYSLLGPYVGVLLDRWSRRSIMVFTNVLRALLVVPAALLTGVAAQGAVFLATVLVVVGLNRLFLSAMSAATPHVVADRHLVTANALSGTVGSIAYSTGLGCALLLLQTVVSAGYHGYGAIAAIAPVGYGVSALLARFGFGRQQLGPDGTVAHHHSPLAAAVEVGRGMLAGIGHLATRRGAAYAMLAQAAFRVMSGVLTLALLLLHRNYFPGDDNIDSSFTALTFVFVAGGVGVFVGALITPPIARRIGGWRLVVVLLAAAAVALLVFGLPFTAAWLLVVVFVVNVAAQGIKIVVDTAIQHECTDAYRGRVFSVNDTTFNLAYVAGMFIAAFTLPDTGHSPPALLAVATGFLLAGAGYAILARRWVQQAGDDIADPDGRPAPRLRPTTS